jgi:PAS domain S-box-containing protein
MPDASRSVLDRPLFRYLMAVVVVAGAFLLRHFLVSNLGMEMPPFLTFYPAIMLVAFLCGFRPGMLATALAVLATDYFILTPIGHFAIWKSSDAVALAIFAAMGIFMSLLAEHYRRSQQLIAKYKVDQVLNENEVLYRNLFNSMDEGFCVIEVLFDPQGSPVDYRFLQVNATFEKQTGLHDAVGKRMRELAPDHEKHWFEIYGKVALTGEPAHIVNEAKALDKYFDVRAFRVGDPQLRQVAIVFNEMSERMRAEKVLREQAELLDLAHDTIMVRGLDGMIHFWNHGAVEMYGFSKEQATGRISHELLGTVFPQPLAEIEALILKNGRWEGELTHTAQDGARIVVASRWALQRDKDGQPNCVMEINNDISERKRAEEHIRRLNRVYAVLSDINETIVRVKEPGAMLEAACRIAVEKGKFRMAWIGMIDPKIHVLEAIASSGLVDGYLDRVKIDLRDSDHGTGPAARCIQLGTHAICNDIEHELYRPWKDDAMRNGYRSVAAFPLRIDDKTIGVFSLYASELSFFDDDETKLLDEMAMDMSFALEVDRHEKDRLHLEEQFRQAQKMESIGQLTGGIAHDFNNLLTVILGCSEVIVDEVKENSHLNKMASMIADAARQGAELTHRMLAFARLQPLQARPVNVNQLLDGMQNFLRRTLSEQIELDLIKGGEVYDALADPTQLESALLNLCVNARDAMPNGGTLTIETENSTLDTNYAEQNPEVISGQYILIAVSDTGSGISPENLDRVFDPFFTTKEVGKGTGLGLSMVYGFAKQSRGHVKIYSEPGRGTSVKLYLPMANQQSEPAAQTHTLIADLHGSEVVLLVEDNESVREFAKSQLITLGYQVLEAANGKGALKILVQRADIQLLFTDIVMPGGLNGRELALEACRINPKLKVLYSSGYAENAILHEGLLDKDVQFLSKPYTRRELAARIRELLTGT